MKYWNRFEGWLGEQLTKLLLAAMVRHFNRIRTTQSEYEITFEYNDHPYVFSLIDLVAKREAAENFTTEHLENWFKEIEKSQPEKPYYKH